MYSFEDTQSTYMAKTLTVVVLFVIIPYPTWGAIVLPPPEACTCPAITGVNPPWTKSPVCSCFYPSKPETMVTECEATLRCNAFQTSLAYLETTEDFSFLCQLMPTDVSFYVGRARTDNATMWNGEQSSPPGCVSVIKTNNTSCYLEETDCALPQGFICRGNESQITQTPNDIAITGPTDMNSLSNIACVAGINTNGSDVSNTIFDGLSVVLENSPLANENLSMEDGGLIVKILVQILGQVLYTQDADQKVTIKQKLFLISCFDKFSNDVLAFMKRTDNNNMKIKESNIVAEFMVMEISTFSGLTIYDEHNTTSVTLPPDLFGELDAGTLVAVASVIYNAFGEQDLTYITYKRPVSKLLTCTVDPNPNTPFTSEVNITFQHTMENETKHQCSYLNESSLSMDSSIESYWATDGCIGTPLVSDDGQQVIGTSCLCNHLTSFAVLMQPVKVEIPAAHLKALSLITFIGCGISSVCLLLCFLIFLVLRLRSGRSFILQNTVISLLLAQLVFVCGIHATGNKYVCMFIAISLHFMFMAAFSWMLVQGINLYVKTKPGNPAFYKRHHFCTVGWGIPIIVVGVSAAIRWDYYGNENYCWLSMKDGMPAAFMGPAMTVILVNTIVLVLVLRKFMGVKANAKKDEADKIKAGLRASIVLLPLLGLTWLFGIFAVSEAALVFQYLFTVFNSLQGVFIFIFHCVLNEEVRTAYRRRRGRSISSDCDESSRSTRTSHMPSSTTTTKTANMAMATVY